MTGARDVLPGPKKLIDRKNGCGLEREREREGERERSNEIK